MSRTSMLLVEDNPNDEKLTVLALKESSVVNDIVVARDGAEALDYLFGSGKYEGRDTSIMPVIVLLDLKLPKVDGLDVLRRIRSDERTKCLPVVVLTTSTEDKDIAESYHLGANSYVCKPVDFNEFMTAAKQLGLYWMLLNESPITRS
ncbi:MAG: response regulator [Thermacetogeniaceae bacterium]